MARITAPTPGFHGAIGDVHFTDSVAVTDDVAVIGYCQGAGYTIEHEEPVELVVEPEGGLIVGFDGGKDDVPVVMTPVEPPVDADEQPVSEPEGPDLEPAVPIPKRRTARP